MKTRLLFVLTVMLTLSASVFAQDIPVGSTKTFTAAGAVESNTNLWTVTGGTGYSIATPDAIETDITFTVPGTYTVSYTETNPSGGDCAVTKTLAVTVTGNLLSMGTAPTSFCAPTTGTSDVTFVVNRSGGTNEVTVSYEYSINGGTATTGTVTIVQDASSANIVLTVDNPTDGFTDNIVSLTITEATDADGNTIDVTTTPLTQTVTLYATPVVTEITFN